MLGISTRKTCLTNWDIVLQNNSSITAKKNCATKLNDRHAPFNIRNDDLRNV